jgi:hypothetical protein
MRMTFEDDNTNPDINENISIDIKDLNEGIQSLENDLDVDQFLLIESPKQTIQTHSTEKMKEIRPKLNIDDFEVIPEDILLNRETELCDEDFEQVTINEICDDYIKTLNEYEKIRRINRSKILRDRHEWYRTVFGVDCFSFPTVTSHFNSFRSTLQTRYGMLISEC